MDSVLLDMDGVLVNFIQGALDVHDIQKTPEEIYGNDLGNCDLLQLLKMTAVAFWKPMNEEFWAKLDWMPDGAKILEIVERWCGRDNICLLTDPGPNYGAVDGKKRWIERHLPRHYKDSVLFGSRKWVCAHSNSILIDDSDKNINRFIEKGGNTILLPRIWNSFHAERHRTVAYLEDRLNVTLTYNPCRSAG